MSRNRQPNLIRCIVAGFTILSAALALGMLWTTPASAEPGPGVHANPVMPEKVDTSYIGLAIKQLAKQGYAIDGPSQVVEAQGDTIKIFAGQKNLVLNLSGKTTTIKDSQGNSLLLSNIAPLTKVYIARKKNDVKIFVLQKSEGRNDS